MSYTVVCMKWGDKYGSEYVNRLYNMVERNLTLPFKFVCFTDNSSGINPKVEVRPLPDMDLPADKERGWRKLSLFRKDVGLEGRVLFLDLDTVIVANINDYLTIPGKFIFIKHWKPHQAKTQGVGETAVYRFEAGELEFLYTYFMENMQLVKSSFRHEQAYVSHELSKRGIANFWPEEWMPSFKYTCMYPFPLCYFMEPRLPKGAKMVVFHGNPTPDQALAGKVKGIKKFIRHVKVPAWLKENWH